MSKENIKVKVTSHEGFLVIETIKPKEDKNFAPVGGSRIGSVLINTGKYLGMSHEAFTYENNYIKVVIPKLESFVKSKLSLGQIIPITLNVKVADLTQTPFAGSLEICKETVLVEITSIKSESVITNENRIKDVIRNISKSEYGTGIQKKKEKDVKGKSTFFKNLWAG